MATPSRNGRGLRCILLADLGAPMCQKKNAGENAGIKSRMGRNLHATDTGQRAAEKLTGEGEPPRVTGPSGRKRLSPESFRWYQRPGRPWSRTRRGFPEYSSGHPLLRDYQTSDVYRPAPPRAPYDPSATP